MQESKQYKKRLKFFEDIIQNFKHTRISKLIVRHKINQKLFLNLQQSSKKFLQKSKKFNFKNLTPNGRLAPKVELEEEFNNYIYDYIQIINSINLKNKLLNFIAPSLRLKVKESLIINKENKNKSDLIHSDCWSGWSENSILFILPISGDFKNNFINFYETPKTITLDWLKKKNFSSANQNLNTRLNLLEKNYKPGYLYIADITTPHSTNIKKNANYRLSIDSPLIFKSKYFKNRFKRNHTLVRKKETIIDVEQINKLKKKYILKCSFNINQKELYGRNSKPIYFLKKL